MIRLISLQQQPPQKKRSKSSYEATTVCHSEEKSTKQGQVTSRSHGWSLESNNKTKQFQQQACKLQELWRIQDQIIADPQMQLKPANKRLRNGRGYLLCLYSKHPQPFPRVHHPSHL